jgi:hypothetical protein
VPRNRLTLPSHRAKPPAPYKRYFVNRNSNDVFSGDGWGYRTMTLSGSTRARRRRRRDGPERNDAVHRVPRDRPASRRRSLPRWRFCCAAAIVNKTRIRASPAILRSTLAVQCPAERLRRRCRCSVVHGRRAATCGTPSSESGLRRRIPHTRRGPDGRAGRLAENTPIVWAVPHRELWPGATRSRGLRRRHWRGNAPNTASQRASMVGNRLRY